MTSSEQARMDRRAMIRKMAGAGVAAWTAPMIVESFVSRAAAASPITSGTIYRFRFDWNGTSWVVNNNPTLDAVCTTSFSSGTASLSHWNDTGVQNGNGGQAATIGLAVTGSNLTATAAVTSCSFYQNPTGTFQAAADSTDVCRAPDTTAAKTLTFSEKNANKTLVSIFLMVQC